MKIGILGGSFDPPHLGHYLVTQQVLELRPDIDKILLMPVFKHQWKPYFAKIEDRLAMLAYHTLDKFEISNIELKRKGVSYTIDTLKELKKQTAAELFWIVGSDIVYEFDKWEKTEELLNLSTFLLFPRDPYHLPKKIPGGFEIIKEKNIITTNISSTIIRQRVGDGKSISHLVLPEVEEYIRKHNLYK